MEAPGFVESAATTAGAGGCEFAARCGVEVKVFEFVEEFGRGAEAAEQFAHLAFDFGGFLQLGPIDRPAEERDRILARGLHCFECFGGAGEDAGHGLVSFGVDDGHGDAAGGAFALLVELPQQEPGDAAHLFGEIEEGVPGGGDGEIVATAIEDGDAGGKLVGGGDAGEFTGDEVLKSERELEVLFGAGGGVEAGTDVIEIGGEDAPAARGGERAGDGSRQGPLVLAGVGEKSGGVSGGPADCGSRAETGNEAIVWERCGRGEEAEG